MYVQMIGAYRGRPYVLPGVRRLLMIYLKINLKRSPSPGVLRTTHSYCAALSGLIFR